ncbi:unnamed protein product [Cylindrotheca closterium]|uniref:Uncharacterized protein n=1 Tax=Cylindrotheca closterium TaxID=2856 RepID=A0AAD2FG46_9STRA|nr:unnamed protein product [Cylindrotheca closterium]
MARAIWSNLNKLREDGKSASNVPVVLLRKQPSVLCGTGLKLKAQDNFAPLNSNLNILGCVLIFGLISNKAPVPCVSAEGNKYVAVYAAACQWARGYALKKESEVSNSLKELFCDISFPRVLRPDDAQLLATGEFRRVANKAQVPIHPSEPYNPDQARRGIPKAFWD